MNWCRRSSINILARFILYESSWAGERINEKVRCSFLRFGQPHKIESFTKVVIPFVILEVESCLYLQYGNGKAEFNKIQS